MPAQPDVFIPSGGHTAGGGKIMGLPKWAFLTLVAGGAVVAYIYFRKHGSSSTLPTAGVLQACTDGSTPDPTTGLCGNGAVPGTNYIPGVSGGGSSGSGGGTTPPPTNIPVDPIPKHPTCPDGSPPAADGSCPTPPPPAPTGGWRHVCLDGGGPGCGGPNRHCEYHWDPTGGQATPPTDCIQAAGGGKPGDASPSPDFASAKVQPSVKAGTAVNVMPNPVFPTATAGDLQTAGPGYTLAALSLTDDHLHLAGQNAMLRPSSSAPTTNTGQPAPLSIVSSPGLPPAPDHGPRWVGPPDRYPPRTGPVTVTA